MTLRHVDTPPPRALRPARWIAVALAASLVGVVCSATPGGASSTKIVAIGVENEYANVLAQIGGKYVSVSSILDNPNTDPHTFEASAQVAEEVAKAQLIVQNGVGYDSFMDNIESATANPSRRVIVVQHVLDVPSTTPNPHLWYKPTTMPRVARAIATALGSLAPAHRAYFEANVVSFDRSLQPWLSAIASFKAAHPHTSVAVTEPVADYLLRAMGITIRTPFVFQADVMNGVDPSPEDVTLEENLLTRHQVALFCYNEQVVDSLTASLRQTAKSSHVPIVGVYETMPTPGYDYQTWMMAELRAIEAAVVLHRSTQTL